MLGLARDGVLAARPSRISNRCFFNLPGLNAGSNSSQSSGLTRYKESKVLPCVLESQPISCAVFMTVFRFSQRQMYDVVKDVKSYPTFLPYCLGAVVSSSRELANRDLLMLATLTVGIFPFKVSYESKVTCRPCEFVKVSIGQLYHYPRKPPISPWSPGRSS
jgi:hypothetical protein